MVEMLLVSLTMALRCLLSASCLLVEKSKPCLLRFAGEC